MQKIRNNVNYQFKEVVFVGFSLYEGAIWNFPEKERFPEYVCQHKSQQFPLKLKKL